jgi:hypothetical protein
VVAVGETQFELVDLGFEPVDVGGSRLGNVSCVADGLQALLELFAQVGVGPVAIEGGAVDA